MNGIKELLEEEKAGSVQVEQDEFVNDITEFEITALFSSKCYIVDVRLEVRKMFRWLTTAMFDTGSVPNLI